MIKKKSTRFMAIVAAVGLGLPTIAGCNQKEDVSGKKQEASTKTTQATTAESKQETKVSETPVEVSVFMVERSDAPMNNDLDVVKELSERTNVRFKWELAPSTNHQEKFNLIIASGELPDIMIYDMSNLLKYAEQGAYEPLNELIDQYAPNIKKVISEDDAVLKELTYTDGNIYTIPMLAAVKVSEVFFMRKDWIDKLGLPIPNTIDEWYKTLKAFKEGDPNGNGLQDEIPYSVRSNKANIMPFIYSWGIEEEFFLEDGRVLYGSIDPRMKEALTWINKLYKEGLIDPEYITIDSQQWQARMTNEVSGVLHDWGGRIDFFNNAVGPINPDVDFVAVLPPQGPTGVQSTPKQMTRIRSGGSAAIAASSKYKEQIIKMYDYIFTEEGQRLMNFGIEGVHYKNENGTFVYNDSIMNNPEGKTPLVALFNFGINRDWPMEQDIQYEQALASEDLKYAWELYEPIIKEAYPKLKFTDKEREVINAKYTEIKTYKDEMIDKFIMGIEPMERFDDFVAQLKSMGIDEVIKVHEAALERYKAQ